MIYDYEKLLANMDAALAEFMHDDELLPGTRAQVVVHVTEMALLALRTFCGESANPDPPAGFLMGIPIKLHETCDDPTCVLCTGKFDIVFGKPSRFSS